MASKHYHFKFNFDLDKEIISRIEAQDNKNDYIRRLILSDMAADILRDSIKLEEKDPEESEYQDRVDFYNDHCPALNNLDHSINYCDGCIYRIHYKDVDGIEKAGCNLEEAWRTHWIHKPYDAAGDYPTIFKPVDTDDASFYYHVKKEQLKTQLNSVYGKMVRDPFKDDVINNMIDNSNASNALDNEIKKGEPDNG